MPIISVMRQGRLMESGRLNGTPKDDGPGGADNQLRCPECGRMFDPDELSKLGYCEECERDDE
jgi:hypothetical protein